MSDFPSVSWRQCVKVLQKKGFYIDRQKGSHIILVRDEPKARANVPRHKTIKHGTLRSILRQAGLTLDEFKDLL